VVDRVAWTPVQRVAADSCPGVLRPHLAADGALVRLRVPGGAVAISALKGLRAAAAELGDGRLGLTSRGNLQVRGIAPDKVGGLEALLGGLGLLPHPTHDRVRNIIASPLSGRGPQSVEDVDPLVTALDAALCARPDLIALPGRFLVGLDDGTGDIAGEEPDVLALAVRPGRFEVRPFGAANGVRVGRARVVEAVLAAATAFLAERAKQDSRAWRVNELPGAAEAMVAALAGAGFAASPNSSLGEPGAPLPGLTEQGDGRFAVCAVVPLGILDGEQMDALAACAELAADPDLVDGGELDGLEFGDAQEAAGLADSPLRVTVWRRVVVRDLELPAALAAQELLAAVGLVVGPEEAWVRITACAGRPGCAKSRADVQADARAFAARGAARGPLVHWAGCERGCGTPHGAVALLAEENGYRVAGELGVADRDAAASWGIVVK
jgi:precorrin-3B synthase